MKKSLVSMFFVFLLLALVTVSGHAAALQTPEQKIVIEEVKYLPEDPYPGQEVTVTIKYRNDGDESIPAGTVVSVELFASGKVIEDGVDKEFTITEEVKAGDSTQAEFNFYAPLAEAIYKMEFKLTAAGFDFDDARIEPAPLNVNTALPPELARLFAGLGLFAAVMAIMAVGTEVIVESLKVLIGLKSKVTAMEAFEQLKTELPGMLTGVGLDAESRKKVTNIVNQMGGALKPVNSIVDVYKNVNEGQFLAAYQKLAELKITTDGEKIKKVKAEAKDQVEAGIKSLQDGLGVSPKMTAAVKDQVFQAIDAFTPGQAADILEDVFGMLRGILKDPVQVENWLLSQVDTYILQGKDGLNKFLPEVKDALTGMGFERKDVESWIDRVIDSGEQVFREKSQVYALSVKNLLQAVEERRNDIQSPLRRLWRRLRKSQVSWWIPVCCIIAVVSWGIWGSWPTTWWRWPFAGAVALLVGFIWAKFSPEGNKGNSIGYYLQHWVEKPYNALLGHDTSRPDVIARYGDVELDIEKKISRIVPTTIASTLLERENRHQEEEVIRVRWMRVITVVVGTWLAYYLQIDAAKYLNYAIPGVEETINQVKLHELWNVIPDRMTVGILLTGMAASAGSKFWRDLLGRLQAARGQAEEAARAVRSVKSMVSGLGGEENR